MIKWFKNLQSWDKMFFALFVPPALYTIWGIVELYTTYFHELTPQDHMQFFLRIFFPISIATFVTVLERRKRLKENTELQKRIKDFLNK